MNLKGIVKIAVFSVIGFVLTMGLGFLTGSFGMLPSLYLSSALPTIIVAPVFVIMCKQVGQRGTAFLYFLLMGVFYVLMGMWPVIAVCAIAGLLAELVIGKKGNYENKNMKIGAAFGAGMFIYSLHAMYFTFVFGVEGLTKQFPKMFTTDYATFLYNFYTPKNILICLLIAILEHIFTINFLVIGRRKVFCRDEKNNINKYQLSDKINPLTIVGLILLFSVVLTIGEQTQYLISLIFVLGLLFLFSIKKAFRTICSLLIVWGLIYLLKPHLGNVLIGSIYTMLLIVLKFAPLFILGRVLSSYSSSHLIAAFRKIGMDGGIGIGITVFFRFIPEISIRMKEINNGMKIRGFKASIFKPIKTFELHFVPLMYKCIDISDTLTCSIISKGIEYDGKKTSFHEVKITFVDIAMMVGGMILLGASLWKIF